MKTKDSENSAKSVFEKFASFVTSIAGNRSTLMIAILLVVAWVISGSIFHYSKRWLLFFNTMADIIVFLMVFLLQKAQRKHSLAIQLKLSELQSSNAPASKDLINTENMNEDELKVSKKYYGDDISENKENEDELIGLKSS